MAKDKKKHHYVPQYYLKGFTGTINSNKIFVYQKGKTKVFRSNILNVGHENHFYSYVHPDGSRDANTVEDFLSQEVESPANSVLDKIRNHQPITEKDKELFSIYLSVMMQRVPRHRDRVKNLQPGILKELSEEIAAGRHKKFTTDHLRTLSLQVIKTFENKVPQEALLPMASPVVTQVLSRMNWAFLTFNGERGFLTSDNPLVFDESLGLANKEAEITFPVSSSVVLWASWQNQQERGFYHIDQQTVDVINQRTVQMASQYIYYPFDEGWVVDLLNML